jgi:hypothetical protein
MFSFTQERSASIHVPGEDSGFPGAVVSDITGEAQEWLRDAGEVFTKVVTNRPTLAMGAAFAAGVFLGWLIKRR